jgi:hypothetical protein
MHNKWILILSLLFGIPAVVLLLLFGFGIFFPHLSPSWLGTGAYLKPDGEIVNAPKTLWDFASLLIIPAVLSFGAIFYNQAVKNTENTKANVQSQENILQDYIDRMSTLMIDKNLCESEEGAPVRSVARTQSRTTIYRLSGQGKGLVIRFLKEGGLINVDDAVILTAGLALQGVHLKSAILNDCNFSHANCVNAKMENVQLQNALCFKTNFTGAVLNKADLRNAVVSRANFNEASCLEANFTNAVLIKTELMNANLWKALFFNAKLNGADFKNANLCGARFDKTNVDGAKFKNATYDASTKWPPGFDPEKAGAKRVKN